MYAADETENSGAESGNSTDAEGGTQTANNTDQPTGDGTETANNVDTATEGTETAASREEPAGESSETADAANEGSNVIDEPAINRGCILENGEIKKNRC